MTIYCKLASPISVNIKPSPSQIHKPSNHIIINSMTNKIEIELLIYQKLYYFRYYFGKKLFKTTKNSPYDHQTRIDSKQFTLEV